MSINGSNIMNDYNIYNNFAKFKIDINGGLSRNFSDIYHNYKTSTKNYNLNYNSVNNSK